MALKSLIAAGFVAATMALLPGAAPAEAKTNIVIGIGAPGWGGNPCWRNHRYCGWAPHPRYVYAPPIFRPVYRPVYYYGNSGPIGGRMSCGAARNLVDRSGFNNVNAAECRGDVYTFRASRNGHRFVVKVNSHSRRIIGTGRI